MPLEYPSTIPGPRDAPFQYADRVMRSSLPGPQNLRPMQHDRLGSQSVEFCFSHEEVAIWEAWVGDDLVRAGAWFSVNWKQPSGGAGVRRFIGEPSFPVYYPNYGWRVEAVVEVRGRGELPTAATETQSLLWDETSTWTLSGGNTVASVNGQNSTLFAIGNSTKSSGAWYAELVLGLGGGEDCDVWVGLWQGSINASRWTRGAGFIVGGGVAAPSSFVTGAVVGIYMNCDTGAGRIYVNNVLEQSLTFTASTAVTIGVQCDNDGVQHSFTIPTSLTYAPPSGALAWD